MKVQIITIGDEILIGQIIDTNSAWMAQQLNANGAQVVRIESIGDEYEEIQQTLDRSIANADVVLITGGLGPTKDDITKKALADYFNTEMEFHPESFERIVKIFERWGRTTTEAHRQQCYMPKNAELLFNKMGSAPGMWFEHKNTVIISMPGVPYEMKYIMKYGVIPRLKERFPMQGILHRTIRTVGEGESRIAERIEDIESALPQHIKLAFLPSLGTVRLRLTAKGKTEEELAADIQHYSQQIEERIPELIYGHDSQKLEEAVGQILKARGLNLATAESCTGGHIGHKITSVPGSSAYFIGGFVAYSNNVKVQQLGVQEHTLKQYGAVSEQTVIEMVKGTNKVLGSDIAVAISGVAGPGGGTKEKPVGTVWIAVGNQKKIVTKKLSIGKDRIKNIEYSSVQALNMIRQFAVEQYNLVTENI
ncbi:MAG: competence/damage-inducible protein A [Saprospiraceae bacterium]|nr:competence/damage-inducible protein A [Saprospiraceae bacterium]